MVRYPLVLLLIHCLYLRLTTYLVVDSLKYIWVLASSFVLMSFETGDDCQINEANNIFPIESLHLPLDSSMRIIFTGHFNGISVEVRSQDEAGLLYHMGCFGKGSFSRSKPRPPHDGTPTIIRKRQYLKRNYWYKKFNLPTESSNEDAFLKEIKELSNKINSDSRKQSGKDVIDLVSSDEDNRNSAEENTNSVTSYTPCDTDDFVVIVPNSDSEGDNYFANLKPKYCLNKIKLEEKLILTLQEAFFLLYGLGCLHILDFHNRLLNIQQCWDNFLKVDPKFVSKYVVYHYFRSKGYVVKPGIKFGGDYSLYRSGPSVNHADYIVVIRNAEDNLEWVSLLGHIRMAVTTGKEILIAEVKGPKEYQKLPENLSSYSVKEVILSRKVGVSINEDIEYFLYFINNLMYYQQHNPIFNRC